MRYRKRFRGSEVQRFWVQRFKGSEVQGLWRRHENKTRGVYVIPPKFEDIEAWQLARELTCKFKVRV
ncbi:MAG: hypothetical protein AVO38_06215 [delta proteobacterium ML8_D]|jgi:hypothetical protein|nr:MAG: hypothetical protein AVO38_06215 [delta proteobacterium ML8_D]